MPVPVPVPVSLSETGVLEAPGLAFREDGEGGDDRGGCVVPPSSFLGGVLSLAGAGDLQQDASVRRLPVSVLSHDRGASVESNVRGLAKYFWSLCSPPTCGRVLLGRPETVGFADARLSDVYAFTASGCEPLVCGSTGAGVYASLFRLSRDPAVSCVVVLEIPVLPVPSVLGRLSCVHFGVVKFRQPREPVRLMYPYLRDRLYCGVPRPGEGASSVLSALVSYVSVCGFHPRSWSPLVDSVSPRVFQLGAGEGVVWGPPAAEGLPGALVSCLCCLQTRRILGGSGVVPSSDVDDGDGDGDDSSADGAGGSTASLVLPDNI